MILAKPFPALVCVLVTSTGEPVGDAFMTRHDPDAYIYDLGQSFIKIAAERGRTKTTPLSITLWRVRNPFLEPKNAEELRMIIKSLQLGASTTGDCKAGVERLREVYRVSYITDQLLDDGKVHVLAELPPGCEAHSTLTTSASSYKVEPSTAASPSGGASKILTVQPAPNRVETDVVAPLAKRRKLGEDSVSQQPWIDFWGRLWGKGEVHLDTYFTTENSIYGTYRTMPADPAFSLWHLEKIMIRKEWTVAWACALEQQDYHINDFIMIGHPGIGKTLSLYFFLVKRVALGLPTFFQTEQNHLMLFHKGGVEFILSNAYVCDVEGIKDNIGATWALVDSNEHVKQPAPILWRLNSPYFIVQASAPCQDHWSWTKDHGGGAMTKFYVKPLSIEEMLQGGLVQYAPVEEQTIREIYYKYGPSARECYTSRGTDLQDIHSIATDESILQLSWDLIIRLIASKDLQASPFNNAVIIEPTEHYGERLTSKANVVTRSVMRYLWIAQRVHIKPRMSEDYSTLSRLTGSVTTASWLYENFVHDLLENGINEPLHTFNISYKLTSSAKYDSHVLRNTTCTQQWRTSKMYYVPFIMADGKLKVAPNRCYVPMDAHFPTDSSFTYELIFMSDHKGPILDRWGHIMRHETQDGCKPTAISLFTIFQIITNLGHHVNEKGLDELLKVAAHNNLAAVAIRFIAVFPPDSEPNIEWPITWRGKALTYGLRLSAHEQLN